MNKAETLKEIPACITPLEPLEVDDPRYVDLGDARGTKELTRFRYLLESCDAAQSRYAQIAFKGHRGSGKTTELRQLEKKLGHRFTFIHISIDESLYNDCEYSDLLLWLVEQLVIECDKLSVNLDKKLVETIIEWFTEKSQEDVDRLKKEIELSAEISSEAKVGVYWLSLKMLSRLKSLITGSHERRHIIRREIQRYAGDLIDRVNLLLDNAKQNLVKSGKTPDLVIVQDNLDKINPNVARQLFIDSSDLLKKLRAHTIYTVPAAMLLSPHNIDSFFESSFTMPMVKPKQKNGSDYGPGLTGLKNIIAARIDIDKLFTSHQVVSYAAKISGGRLRDLLRLVRYAQLDAQADGSTKISKKNVEDAAIKSRLNFETLLQPPGAYMPLLAKLAATKEFPVVNENQASYASTDDARKFFADLLTMGAVIEYNGECTWYDIHPVIHSIESFKHALKKITT